MPHMGWNGVLANVENKLVSVGETPPRFYFLHSYYFDCEEMVNVTAITNYGFPFASIVSSGNIYGVQFHPEKSHHFGTKLLKNFAEL